MYVYAWRVKSRRNNRVAFCPLKITWLRLMQQHDKMKRVDINGVMSSHTRMKWLFVTEFNLANCWREWHQISHNCSFFLSPKSMILVTKSMGARMNFCKGHCRTFPFPLPPIPSFCSFLSPSFPFLSLPCHSFFAAKWSPKIQLSVVQGRAPSEMRLSIFWARDTWLVATSLVLSMRTKVL